MMTSLKPLYCDVCEKAFSGRVPAVAHYNSASHKQKQYIAESTDAPGVKCSTCNVTCSSDEAYAAHKKSPRHEEIAKRASQREATADVSSDPASNGDKVRSPTQEHYIYNGKNGICFVCNNLPLNSPQHATQHINGKAHKLKVAAVEFRKEEAKMTKVEDGIQAVGSPESGNYSKSLSESSSIKSAENMDSKSQSHVNFVKTRDGTGSRLKPSSTNVKDEATSPEVLGYAFNGVEGYCYLCKVYITSEKLGNEHIKGNKHRMMYNLHRERDQQPDSTKASEPVSMKGPNIPESFPKRILEIPKGEKKKKDHPDYVFYCYLCEVEFSSETEHVLEANHIRAQKKRLLDQTSPSHVTESCPAEDENFVSRDDVMKVEESRSLYDSPEISLTDFNEEESTNNIEVDDNSPEITLTSSASSELSVISSKENDDPSIQSPISSKRGEEYSDESVMVPKDVDSQPLPSSKFCDICKVRYTSVEQTEAHLNGQKHKRAVKRLELPTESYCPLCDMDFSGPEPLQQHLEGTKHKKELQNQKSKQITDVSTASNIITTEARITDVSTDSNIITTEARITDVSTASNIITTEARSPIVDELTNLKLPFNASHNYEESLIPKNNVSDKISSELSDRKFSLDKDAKLESLTTPDGISIKLETKNLPEKNRSEIMERPLEEIKPPINIGNGDAASSGNKMVLPEITENSSILIQHYMESKRLEGSIDDVEIVPNRKGANSKSRFQVKKLPNRSSKKSPVKDDRSPLDSASLDDENFMTCNESLEISDVEIGKSEQAGAETSALCANLSPGVDPIVEEKIAHAAVSPTVTESERIASLEISDIEVPGTSNQANAGASTICTNLGPGVHPIVEKKIAHAVDNPTVMGNDGNNRPFAHFPYYCEICNKPANTKEAFDSHLKGKIHKNRVSTCSTVPEHRQHFELGKVFNYDINSEMDLMTEKPRKYQKEIFVKAMKADSICFLPTGTGKTRIAAMLINQMLRENPTRQVLFLVDKVLLGMQQGKVFEKLLKEKMCTRFTDELGGFEERAPVVEVLSGGQQSSGVPLWKIDIIVATAAYCMNLLMNKALRWTDFSLVILDEAHHCIGGHPYNRVMKEYHCRLHPTEQPKIIGLTASPAGQRTLESTRQMLANLQRNLGGAKVAIVERHIEELNLYKSNAKLVVKRIILSAPEKEFLEVLRLYMAECYCLLYHHNPEKFYNMLELNFSHLHPEKLVPYLSGETLTTLQYGLEMYQIDNDLKASQKLRLGGLLYHAKAICRAVTAMDDAGISCALDELSPLLVENKYGSFDIVEHEGLDSRKLIHLMKVYGCMDENQANPTINPARDEAAGASNTMPLESHVVKLVQELTDYKYIDWRTKKNMPMALVLVKTRQQARFYCERLRVAPIIKELGLNVIFLTGHGAASVEKGMDVKKQRVALDDIQANKYQIIVATSVAEEGLDLPECEIVIAMSLPTSVTALVQMRGRARKKDSYFIVMCNNEAEEAKIIDMLKRERNIEIASRELAEKDELAY